MKTIPCLCAAILLVLPLTLFGQNPQAQERARAIASAIQDGDVEAARKQIEGLRGTLSADDLAQHDAACRSAFGLSMDEAAAFCRLAVGCKSKDCHGGILPCRNRDCWGGVVVILGKPYVTPSGVDKVDFRMETCSTCKGRRTIKHTECTGTGLRLSSVGGASRAQVAAALVRLARLSAEEALSDLKDAARDLADPLRKEIRKHRKGEEGCAVAYADVESAVANLARARRIARIAEDRGAKASETSMRELLKVLDTASDATLRAAYSVLASDLEKAESALADARLDGSNGTRREKPERRARCEEAIDAAAGAFALANRCVESSEQAKPGLKERFERMQKDAQRTLKGSYDTAMTLDLFTK